MIINQTYGATSNVSTSDAETLNSLHNDNISAGDIGICTDATSAYIETIPIPGYVEKIMAHRGEDILIFEQANLSRDTSYLPNYCALVKREKKYTFGSFVTFPGVHNSIAYYKMLYVKDNIFLAANSYTAGEIQAFLFSVAEDGTITLGTSVSTTIDVAAVDFLEVIDGTYMAISAYDAGSGNTHKYQISFTPIYIDDALELTIGSTTIISTTGDFSGVYTVRHMYYPDKKLMIFCSNKYIIRLNVNSISDISIGQEYTLVYPTNISYFSWIISCLDDRFCVAARTVNKDVHLVLYRLSENTKTYLNVDEQVYSFPEKIDDTDTVSFDLTNSLECEMWLEDGSYQVTGRGYNSTKGINYFVRAKVVVDYDSQSAKLVVTQIVNPILNYVTNFYNTYKISYLKDWVSMMGNVFPYQDSICVNGKIFGRVRYPQVGSDYGNYIELLTGLMVLYPPKTFFKIGEMKDKANIYICNATQGESKVLASKFINQ